MAASRRLRASGLGRGSLQRDRQPADRGVAEEEPQEEALNTKDWYSLAAGMVANFFFRLHLVFVAFFFLVHRGGRGVPWGLTIPFWVKGHGAAGAGGFFPFGIKKLIAYIANRHTYICIYIRYARIRPSMNSSARPPRVPNKPWPFRVASRHHV